MTSRSAQSILDEARSITDARLAARAAELRQTPGHRDGEALAYALGTAGKRVRPALVLACYRAAGGSAPGIAGIAAAIEIVHTYSLVHDDLPCMDDDAQRRGRPTTHVQFDVPTATRAGFALVPVAVEELAQGAEELRLPASRLGVMGATLLEASGIRGMVGGQWLDLEAEGRRIGTAELIDIHRRKTGALIEAACALGALAASAPEPVLEVLTSYGREVGVAFQIADDLLDATATSEQLGKTAGRDATLEKATYVTVLGEDGARREAVRHAQAARDALARGGLRCDALTTLADYIVSRRS